MAICIYYVAVVPPTDRMSSYLFLVNVKEAVATTESKMVWQAHPRLI